MVPWLLPGVRESLKVCLNAETLERIWKEKNAISSKREYSSNEFIRGFFTTLHGLVLVSQSAVTRRMTAELYLNIFFLHKYMALFVLNDFHPDVELCQIPKFKPFLPSCSRFSRSVLRYIMVISSLPCRISSQGRSACRGVVSNASRRHTAESAASLGQSEWRGCMRHWTWVESLDAATNTVKWMQWLSAWWFQTWLS